MNEKRTKPAEVTVQDLVFLEPNKARSVPFTTSDIIAEHTGISYRSIQRTIEKQIGRLERFGIMRFEITLSGKAGRPKKVYRLNEEQATLLITFLKNTDVVADFKVELVRQFYAMRRLLMERQSEQWRQARSGGKAVRRLETDAIKAFVDYAADGGSEHAGHYYGAFTTMVYKALGIESGRRNVLPAATLRDLQMTEQVVERAIWAELAAGTEYHEAFQNVKGKVQQIAALAFVPRAALLSDSTRRYSV